MTTLAVTAYGCLLVAVGRRVVAARVRPWAATCRGAVAVFALANVPVIVLSFLVALFVRIVPGVANYTSGNPASGGPFAAEALYAGAAGLSEEVLAVALPVLAAFRLFPRMGRTGQVLLTVALVVLRLSYHAEYGGALVPLVPWATVMAVIYIRTRSLASMVLAHTVHDVMVDVTSVLYVRGAEVAGWALELGLGALAWWACLRWAAPDTEPGNVTAFDAGAS